jgi:hypothetical protein
VKDPAEDIPRPESNVLPRQPQSVAVLCGFANGVQPDHAVHLTFHKWKCLPRLSPRGKMKRAAPLRAAPNLTNHHN